MALNLEKQLLFYGKYHHNPVNVLIHIIGVPLILFTGLFFGAQSPSLPVPISLQIPYFPLNACTIVASVYATLYVLLEPVAGALVAPLILGVAGLSNHLAATLPWEPSSAPAASFATWEGLFGGAPSSSPTVDLRSLTYVAIALNVGGWVGQFVGHGKFERRAPALLDNLFQALFLAPLFVWLEILFMLGYRPELRARVEAAVEREVKKYREGLDKKEEGETAKSK